MIISKRQKQIGIIFASFLTILTALYFHPLPIVMYGLGKIKAYESRPGGSVAGLSIIKLEVPYHKQEHSLSCELASLQMILNYAGVPVTESEIIDKLSFDGTKKTKYEWGDPDHGFVGNINGRMGITGYGVHANPVATVAENWKPAEALENLSPQALAKLIFDGNPIVVWGYYGRGKPMSWKTPDGKIVTTVNGEHARVVTGFVGDITNPEGFFLLDPIYGELYWDTQQLMDNMQPLGNTGVVVYK